MVSNTRSQVPPSPPPFMPSRVKQCVIKNFIEVNTKTYGKRLHIILGQNDRLQINKTKFLSSQVNRAEKQQFYHKAI